MASPMRADASVAMATISTPIEDAAEWHNPNVVKVVCDANGDAIYFSRSPIPYWRDQDGVPDQALRHIGVYGYRRDFLLDFASWPPGQLEQIEKLEQLRAMERGCRIRVVRSLQPSIEVDTPEDLARAVTASMNLEYRSDR
jgi:3-deoxy-manno-octulosonate cytidylyltransferase (CMP-KDO synthetase)